MKWRKVGLNERGEFYASPECALVEGNFGHLIAACTKCGICMPELKDVPSEKDYQYIAAVRAFKFCPFCGDAKS